MLLVRELLRNDLFAKPFGLLELPEAYSITELEKHLSQGDLVFGLLKDSQVVGFALVRCVSDEGELLFIVVGAPHRSSGLGTMLLESLLEEIGKRGIQTLFLEVSEANLAAQRLYEKLGFERIGLRERYYPDGTSALVLSKALC